MLTNATQLKGRVIRAADGEIESGDQFHFADKTWATRYLTVKNRGWLGDRKVLISPVSVIATDRQGNRSDVALTMKQFENSSNIDTHRPISRQVPLLLGVDANGTPLPDARTEVQFTVKPPNATVPSASGSNAAPDK